MKEPLDVQALALEVADSNFADERLNRRLCTIVTGLAGAPTESLPQSFDSAALEAAYRFFANHRVTPDDILKPHAEATRGRCEAELTFLVLHDSTAFSYRFDGQREGLGRGPRSAARGGQTFFAHVSLAVAADGTRRPLGVAALKTWVRGPTAGQVECDRWEQQIKLSSSRLNGRAKAIHVMDREADDYKMLDALISGRHRFIVRSQFDRLLHDSSVGAKMRDRLKVACSRVEREVPLTRRATRAAITARQPARAARMAKLSVAAISVVVKRTTTIRHRNTLMSGSLELNVVRVWEAEPPPGATAVEWTLCTTEPIDTPAQQLAIVDYYRARWTIEEYFKAIKTGCDFEKRQLQDYEGLVNLLATFAPIAYRLLLIRSEARRNPDANALTVVSQDHLDVLRVRGRLKLSVNPTAREVYFAIAALGGHLKRNADPGWRTLAKGYQKLDTLTEGWVAAKLQVRSDQR